MVEREVKLKTRKSQDVVGPLRGRGIRLLQERLFEDNQVWDYPDLRLHESGQLLRLRRFGCQHLLTYKGPASTEEGVKTRQEVELNLPSNDPMIFVLERLGLRLAFRYQKYRTIYGVPPEDVKLGLSDPQRYVLKIMVDETPIGGYLELEGEPDLIVKTARVLGYSKSEFILQSYRELYLEDCQRRGIEPDHMVFDSPAGAGS